MAKRESATRLIHGITDIFKSRPTQRRLLNALADRCYTLLLEQALQRASESSQMPSSRQEAALLPLKIALEALAQAAGIDYSIDLGELTARGEKLRGFSTKGWDHQTLEKLVAERFSLKLTPREPLTAETIAESILENRIPLLSMRPEYGGSRFVIVTGFRIESGRVSSLCTLDPLLRKIDWHSVDLLNTPFSWSRGLLLSPPEEHTSWVEIDLEALALNTQTLKSFVGNDVALLAIVKADGYGHGLVETARTIAACNAVQGFGVATLEEARSLRAANIQQTILVLYHVSLTELGEAVRSGISLSLYSDEVLQALDTEAQRAATKARVHLVVDTGMGWYGLAPEEATDFAKRAAAFKNIEIEGVYTHFSQADSDDPNKEFSRQQIRTFTTVLQELRRARIEPKWVHAANTAGLMSLPESHYEMVRPGISLYGVYPRGVDRSLIQLHPVLSYKTKIVQVRHMPRGSTVSYGSTWSAPRDSLIAVLPVGYSDGLSRGFSNNSQVIVKGRRSNIVGNICMNITMVDVTDIPDVRAGDIVTLIGRQGDIRISAEELAAKQGTISYEVLTSIGAHVPRVYVNKKTGAASDE